MTTRIQNYRGSYLTPSFEHATVADAMRSGVISCSPDAAATTVAQIMATNHIHSVVVEGIHLDPVRGEQLKWGVVSDMDLLGAARAGIDELTAGEIAMTEPLTVMPSSSLDDAVRLMDEHQTAHAIVVDRGRPVGILSTLDIAGVMAWGRAT
jgi:CBS domain-containing protein